MIVNQDTLVAGDQVKGVGRRVGRLADGHRDGVGTIVIVCRWMDGIFSNVS